MDVFDGLAFCLRWKHLTKSYQNHFHISVYYANFMTAHKSDFRSFRARCSLLSAVNIETRDEVFMVFVYNYTTIPVQQNRLLTFLQTIDPFLVILQLSPFGILSSILEYRPIMHCMEKIKERSINF